MHRRQPLPRMWLMTDPRMGEALWQALDRLPRGSGVVFRHYGAPDRRALFERVRRVTRRRGLVLVLAGSPREAIGWRADGAHGCSPHRYTTRPLLRTAPVHHGRELAQARADAVFLSPVFPTRSHPGAPALGVVRFGLLAAQANVPVIALGGLSQRRFKRLIQIGADGWAGIDAFIDQPPPVTAATLDQNLKVVPR